MKPNMKLFQTTPLDDYIMIVPVMSAERCAEIVAQAQATDSWNATGTESNTTDPALRNCDTLDISSIRADTPPWADIDREIYYCVETAVRAYRLKHKLFAAAADTGYEMLRYGVGTRCEYHTDSHKDRQRTLSCSISLNNDYEGGEFEFFQGERTYRAPAGSAILFPSNFQYPHRVLPITAGTRYSIITWLV